MKTLSVLYQDEQLVGVNKPEGLLVHRTNIDRHETEHAMRIVRNQVGRWVYPFHRLDKATSGVLLFALDKETGSRMTRLFADEQISKSYIAVVRGFAPEHERIDYPLREEWDRLHDPREDRDKPAKPAVTQYHRLATVELPFPVGRYSTARYSLIRASPMTGRNHQIRRHMKHVFHPVINDTSYGDGKQNAFFREQFNCRRLLLHAQSIEFTHPWTGKQVRVQAPLDDAFASLLETLGWGGVDLA